MVFLADLFPEYFTVAVTRGLLCSRLQGGGGHQSVRSAAGAHTDLPPVSLPLRHSGLAKNQTGGLQKVNADLPLFHLDFYIPATVAVTFFLQLFQCGERECVFMFFFLDYKLSASLYLHYIKNI